jgi:ribosome-binding protein aMBF1 (putative translation factor)
MKSTCPVCGQTYRGIALTTVKDAQPIEVCPTCYKTLDAEIPQNKLLSLRIF